jgi:hypothetical protein
MELVDAILNLALLFLWIDWRSGAVARRPQSVLTLANAVRPAERNRGSGLGSLGALVFILAVRPVFYYSIGSKLGWTPELDLLALAIPWRSDLLELMYLYSLTRFVLLIAVYYAVLLLLSALNRNLPDSEVVQQFVKLQLGWLEAIPWYLKPLLPSVVAFVAWVAAVPALTALGALPPQPPTGRVWGQALAFALGAVLAWKWFLFMLFLLHSLNSYVYLGRHPVWPYISLTARRLLCPVRFLTLPKVDLAPIAGIAIVFCVTEYLVEPCVLQIFHHFSA